MSESEQAWFVFAHPVGAGHVAIPCATEEQGRRRMQDYAYKNATFPFEVPLLRTRVCTRSALSECVSNHSETPKGSP